jgi:hypothetical protein
MKRVSLLLLLVCGCGVDGVTTPPPATDPFTGAWALLAVDGHPLPYVQPEPPFNPNQHIRPGATIISGGIGIVLRDSYNGLSLVTYCQRWTGSDGISRNEAVSERVFVTMHADSITILYVDRPDRPDDVGVIEAANLHVTQRQDGRTFLFGGRTSGATPGCP